MMDRRDAVVALLSGLTAPLRIGAGRSAQRPAGVPDFADIEKRVAGRLGVAVLDVASRRHLEYRAAERFPMCSTFKWLLGAQVLSRVDSGHERLERVVAFGERDLLDYAPVTRAHVREGGMAVSDLVAAAIQYSDNTAANLLLGTVGGPAALTAYLRQIGDRTTRLDRIEPDLNSAIPGDKRDTTTPGAMLANMNALLVGDRLTDASRNRLVAWLEGNTTGAARLRAGLPSTWRVGDKTGSGGHGSTNDVAITWPTGRGPLLMAVYLTGTDASEGARNEAIAQVGQQVARWMGDL
jgi:beta-lactamase class A